MSMIIREPFPELMSLGQAMNRLFEGSVVRPANILPVLSGKLAPPVDIYQDQERSYGSFCRSLNLPSGRQTDKADATMEDGILTLNIPKSEEAKPRTIKIKAKEK